jgi:hypothetical protein
MIRLPRIRAWMFSAARVPAAVSSSRADSVPARGQAELPAPSPDAASSLVGVHRGLDWDLDQIRPQVANQRPGVGLGLLAGVGGGHDDAAHPLGTEGIGGDQGDERRVDPPRPRPAPGRSRSCVRSRATRASVPHRPPHPAPAARRDAAHAAARRGCLEPGEQGAVAPAGRASPGSGSSGPAPPVAGFATRLQVADDELLGELGAPSQRLAVLPRRSRCVRRIPARPGHRPGCRPRTPPRSPKPVPAPSAPDTRPGRAGKARRRD